jgi:hypothetical protein
MAVTVRCVAHASVGAALCECAPTKKRAFEPSRRCCFSGSAALRRVFGDGRAAVCFIDHAALDSALCEGAPAKRKAFEHFPPLLLRRLSYKTWLLATTWLWFVSSLKRLLAQRFVRALRGMEAASARANPPRVPTGGPNHRPAASSRAGAPAAQPIPAPLCSRRGARGRPPRVHGAVLADDRGGGAL